MSLKLFFKALHPESKLVHRKTGEVHQQTFHVRSQEAPKQKEQLTMLTMMQRYSTEEAAREYFENLRWPDGPVCPSCGSQKVYEMTANKAKRIRPGLYKCADCRNKFTVTVGTIMESTHLPLNKWLLAFYMMCASKTQVSALQLQRQLDIGSYASAHFMCHRIRYALSEVDPTYKLKGTVEVDETYIGGKAKGKGRGFVDNKTPVISAIERGGEVRSQVVDKVTGKIIRNLLDANVDRSANLNTDESKVYVTAGRKYASHDVVNHSEKEYSRKDPTGRLATTNTAEGYFGNTKRSIAGTHHQISPQHTGLYMSELDFKYNTRKLSDGERTETSIPRIAGKRLKRKELYRRRFEMDKKPVKKADVGQDELQMDADDFDAMMRKALGVPAPKTVKAHSPIKLTLKSRKAK